ncbi:Methyltransferase type 11 [Methanocorpusculum labreanum Z]|uniref:Methyltransferase type 11 n=1 Tax=Methanocorpusculum labreanum (strain ATCC 43576 / DSM 4855 / Z) TaxID=410358 RepID=A2SU41_METLZ|nr:class I SAM-dependent methyltransferase [Methanocorpusculum labreanum]ABN07847.1 Methyltransferase type 11 [Methanocorpusculum labreanum Z]
MELLPIGNVHNHTSEESLKMLPLWRQAISGIDFADADDGFFTEKYSHYIITHDPLCVTFPSGKEELNKRFCAGLGTSVVSYIRKEGNMHYVRGLMAENGANIYSIAPYTYFDRVEEAQFPQSYMEPRKMRAFAEVLPLLSGKNILDVGCGLGTLAIKIAEAKPESLVYGIDLLESSVEQSKLNAEVEGVANTRFVVANTYELPFEEGYFDSVVCIFMLHHLDDIPGALRDIKRVLKPSGEVFAVEPIDHFHDVQRYPDDWKELFRDAGYEVEVWEKDNISFIRACLK